MKPRSELPWVDYCKGVAMLWIFVNHVSEQLLGGPMMANPSARWPPLADRVAQLGWIDGHSLGGIALNLFRYVGWTGDQGVGLFLILSGFGLTWGLLARQGAEPLALRRFYWRRAERVYPLWWTAHLVFMASWVVTGFGLAIVNPATYLSFLGIRVTPGLFFYFTPAWWYIGLLIQLYLVYPVLWNALRKWGAVTTLVATCGIAFLIRLAGLLWLHDFIPYWSLGAIFVTRLPDFTLGIFLASQFHTNPETADARLRSRHSILVAALVYLIGTGLSLTLAGMAIAQFMLGSAGIVLLYGFFNIFTRPNVLTRILGWVGKHSYSLFLAHHPFVQVLLDSGTPVGSSKTWVRVGVAAFGTVIFALFLEKVSDYGVALIRQWGKSIGPIRVFVRLGTVAVLLVALVLGAEFSVWKLAPQEVLGWGERPSLELHPVFGWRLKPSQTTRLRWQGYDYVVTANSLGFPGPEYPAQKPPGTFRILTTGDAFTSAEGVNTEDAWPRLIESRLASKLPGRRVEVMNFAITGYGPNEYAAVVKTFAPVYRPDLVLVEFFVNDYEDVLHGPEFARSIGFDQPSPESTYALFRFLQLRRVVKDWVKAPLVSLLRGEPESHGYFLGNISALERGDDELKAKARTRVAARLAEIKAAAEAVGARSMLALAPASVQVCGPGDLPYFPHHINLSDATRFDMDLPQRTTKAIAEPLGFQIVDLRPVLKQTPGGCPYQRWNMHWTAAGHRQVAEKVSDLLISSEKPALHVGVQ